jgi:hypothetical protein
MVGDICAECAGAAVADRLVFASRKTNIFVGRNKRSALRRMNYDA